MGSFLTPFLGGINEVHYGVLFDTLFRGLNEVHYGPKKKVYEEPFSRRFALTIFDPLNNEYI